MTKNDIYFIVHNYEDSGILTLTDISAYITYKEDDFGPLYLIGQKRVTNTWTYCHRGLGGEGEVECGLICSDYSPCNGRSGRCRHLMNGFDDTGRYYVLISGSLTEIDYFEYAKKTSKDNDPLSYENLINNLEIGIRDILNKQPCNK